MPSSLISVIYFNPRSPCGERHLLYHSTRPASSFQPTLPVRGATRSPHGAEAARRFQPTLPVRGATHIAAASHRPAHISTHAPRAGSDTASNAPVNRHADFNPRSPCGERRIWLAPKADCISISTHAPRAGSDIIVITQCICPLLISTHAPRAGSDAANPLHSMTAEIFQPTLPVRGAT